MKVSELGEYGLIELLGEIVGPPPTLQPDILKAIGDDAAVFRASDPVQILTIDTMVEGVHFRLDTTSWRDLGWKAIAINISDIAAMGGVPHHAVVSLALNPDTDVDSVAEMYRGMADIAQQYQCTVVGGDTVSSTATVITVALTGQPFSEAEYPDNVLNRNRAKVGHQIAVTGYLGGSEAGLRMLTNNLDFDEDVSQYITTAHNHPTPRVDEGQLLLKHVVKAAMDLSDGLLADLPKLCKASGVAAKVNIDSVPIHSYIRRAFGDEALELALSGGEDYELLFTAEESIILRVTQACSVPVAIIGEVVEGEPGKVTLVDSKGSEVKRTKKEWEHFTASGIPRTKPS